ncbi:MAG: hypothetical protein AMXMBFR12_02390 [Candidatus Babeliales bacterium]
MNCAQLYVIFLLSTFFVFNYGMDKPMSVGAKPPERLSTPLVDFLIEFNFQLIDQSTLTACKTLASQSSSHVLTSEDDILEDSLRLRQLDS